MAETQKRPPVRAGVDLGLPSTQSTPEYPEAFHNATEIRRPVLRLRLDDAPIVKRHYFRASELEADHG